LPGPVLDRSQVVTRGTPPRWRVAGQQAGAICWHSWPTARMAVRSAGCQQQGPARV